MSEPLTADDYGSWVGTLFQSRDFGRVVLVSAGVSGGLFVAGYAVAAAGGIPYLTRPEGYLSVFAVFWMLAYLGAAEAYYVDLWNEVRSAFDVDEERYRAVVEPHLAEVHDTRRVLLSAAALLVPYLLIVGAAYLPGSPFQTQAVGLFLGNETDYPTGVASTLVFVVLAVPIGVLIATIFNAFVSHLKLVRDVSELPFRDVYAAASELEPIASFTVVGATVWFLGISFVVVWIRIGVGGTFGMVIIAVLVFTGTVFFVAPQLLLHDALMEAKRSELRTVHTEYRRLDRRMKRGDEPADGVDARLEVTDRRLESAKTIRTWVYDLSSIGKLVAAAAIPGLTFVQNLVSTAELLVGG